MRLKPAILLALLPFVSIPAHAEMPLLLMQAAQASTEENLPVNDQGTAANSVEANSAQAEDETGAASKEQAQAAEDLWERIRIGFSMTELDTSLVQEHERWYAERPDYVQRMAERSQRYLYHIVEEVEKRGMPTEIALLPMIESAFNPKAYSRSRASGIWQFIPSTGKNFGLKQNWWYDGRRDIVAATDAALDYLQKLHDMFGSWELALAAYNWGEGSVARAIARNQAKGEPTDYLSLRMPAETRNYVPKLLAVKHIVMNPAAYGLSLNAIPNRPYFTSVTTKKHIDLALAARLANVPLDEFVALNPAYNRPVIASSGENTLLLPLEKADTFTSNLVNYAKPLVSWQTYKAKVGEKLSKIASKFGIATARLKEVNGIPQKRTKVSASQPLLVPAQNGNRDAVEEVAALAARTPSPETADAKAPLMYTVKKGDTLLGIAHRYHVPALQLKAWNNLKSNRLATGQKLALRTPDASSKKTVVAKNGDHKRTQYVVRRGDSLSSIAKRFKVAVNDIERWNNISAKRPLSLGSKVTVYIPRKG